MRSDYEKRCAKLQHRYHTNCLFRNILRKGTGLSFSFDEKGSLRGTFYCHEKYQGYKRRIHGGIMAAVIDEAMVHCLMGHGVVGVTTDLSIRYRIPVAVNRPAEIVAVVEESYLDGKVRVVRAEVTQDRGLALTARGKFLAVNRAVEQGVRTR